MKQECVMIPRDSFLVPMKMAQMLISKLTIKADQSSIPNNCIRNHPRKEHFQPNFVTDQTTGPDHASLVVNQGTHLQNSLCHKTLLKSQLPVVNSRASWIGPVVLLLPSTKQSTPMPFQPKLQPLLPAVLPALLRSSPFNLQSLLPTSLPSPGPPCHF